MKLIKKQQTVIKLKKITDKKCGEKMKE